jgi:uncharacterized protein (TIGR02646 family)
MIRVKRGPSPDVLTRPGGPGDEEKQKALAHYADPVKRLTSFSFKIYKHEDVKDALNDLFHFKCAYCESYFGATAPVDIEHFRPKLAVERKDGTLVKPGYYWLAADWDNLLPSCIDCNRARIHERAGLDDPELSGKANLFPIEGDGRLNLDPGAEAGEQRLLIHPCRDQVERFFAYRNDKIEQAGEEIGLVIILPSDDVSSTSARKANVSIDVYGLNRHGLATARFDKFKRLHSQVDSVAKSLRSLIQDPDGEARQRELALGICELQALESDDAPYAGMSRTFTAAARAKVNEKITAILGNRLDPFPGNTPIERLIAKFPCPPRVFDPGADLGDLIN